MKVFAKVLTALLLLLYLLILVKQILIKFLPLQVLLQIVIDRLTFNSESEIFWGSHNFIPFKTIFYYLFVATDMSFSVRIANLAGNVIGFMPFGFLMPILSRKFFNLKFITLATFCLSLAFELTQLLFGLGSFDVDDLLLNTIGGMLGYFVVSLLFKFISRKKSDNI